MTTQPLIQRRIEAVLLADKANQTVTKAKELGKTILKPKIVNKIHWKKPKSKKSKTAAYLAAGSTAVRDILILRSYNAKGVGKGTTTQKLKRTKPGYWRSKRYNAGDATNYAQARAGMGLRVYSQMSGAMFEQKAADVIHASFKPSPYATKLVEKIVQDEANDTIKQLVKKLVQ